VTYFVVLALVFVLSGVLVFGAPLLVVLLFVRLLLDCNSNSSGSPGYLYRSMALVLATVATYS